MAWFPVLFLLAWPALEIAVFIKMMDWLGFLGAVLGIVVSGMAGMAVLRRQSLETAIRSRAMMSQGQMPVRELFDTAALSLSGLMLMLPGYVTTLLGLLLLIPTLRGALYALLAGRFTVASASTASSPGGGSTVIDGEWSEVHGAGDGPEDTPPKQLE